ncbi:MAG: MerR family transcriptional regulator [Muribaculaceae bacterium]|nr:MerR family transcriptional regulator [Muribaculaceae bacterium]
MNKTFYTIGEVADFLDIPSSTLRYWESQFRILSPSRSPAGRRRYTATDIEKIRKLYYLVKEKGLKLDAAQAELKRNPSNIDNKFRAIERLRTLKGHLQLMIEAIDDRLKHVSY